MLPGMSFMPEVFPKSTPEESDDYRTPDENGIKTVKTVRNNHPFAHLFGKNLTVIPVRESLQP